MIASQLSRKKALRASSAVHGSIHFPERARLFFLADRHAVLTQQDLYTTPCVFPDDKSQGHKPTPYYTVRPCV